MSLYEFATTADDSELADWHNPKNTTDDQYNMIRSRLGDNGKFSGLILWAEPDKVCRNNMTFEEARMFMCFVALATGEQPLLNIADVNTKEDNRYNELS